MARVGVVCGSILTQPLTRTLTLTLTLTPTIALSAEPHRMMTQTTPTIATAANVISTHSRSQRCVGWADWIREPRDMMSGGYRTFMSDMASWPSPWPQPYVVPRACRGSSQPSPPHQTTMESAVITPVSLTQAVCVDSDPQPSGRYDSRMPQLGAGDLGCLHGKSEANAHDTGCFTTRMYSSGTGRLQNSSLR